MKHKHAPIFSRGSRFTAGVVAGGLVCQFLSFASPASAQIVTLTSGNSSSQIDLGSQAGMFNWLVDGVNVLNQQTFFTRTNPLGTASPVSSLGIPTVTQPTASSVSATYSTASFNVTTVYNLVGQAPGSGTSDISEQIKILNNTASPLVFNFFQFANFAGNGNVVLGQNSHGFFNEAFISGGGLVVTENLDTGISPGANDGAVGDPATILADITGAPGYTPSGPDSGQGAWALEWERTINPNSSLIISKDLNAFGVAPEPPAWSLVSMGLVALGALRHYRSRRSK
jgi:hypothetical protein